ncbi:MAG: T9SS type A sorting domain-containing protein [Edaphocola sp.]
MPKKLLTILCVALSVNATAQWNKSTSNPTYGIYKVDFPAINAAYAIGDLGTLYKSTDAGVTWAEHYNFGPFSSLSDVQFFNADTGFVSMGMGYGITFDGGTTWSSLGEFPKLKICNNFLYTSYVSNDTAYIQTSDNYGSSWNVLYQHYETDAQPFQLAFLNVDSAYFINPNQLDRAYKTTNAFATIDTILIFTGDLVLQPEFDFKDMTYGFLYGGWGSESHPTRAWGSPMDLDGFGVLPVLDLDFKTSKLYASSLYGKIFVSGNNGSTWTAQNVPDNTPVNSVSMLNDSVGIAVGKGFYYTTNGGTYTTSIQNPALKSHFKIYPNPTNDIIHLEYDNAINIQNIQLTDVSGKVIKTFKKNEKALNVSGVASGVYFLKIQAAEGSVREKIVVE